MRVVELQLFGNLRHGKRRVAQQYHRERHALLQQVRVRGCLEMCIRDRAYIPQLGIFNGYGKIGGSGVHGNRCFGHSLPFVGNRGMEGGIRRFAADLGGKGKDAAGGIRYLSLIHICSSVTDKSRLPAQTSL